jgi:hypothetical protein
LFQKLVEDGGMDWGTNVSAEENMPLTIWSDGILQSAIIEVFPLSV